MVYRCIAPDWLKIERKDLPPVQEGEFDFDKLTELNLLGYNIYFLPNSPSEYDSNRPVNGSDIDQFNYVFVDMDLKLGVYTNKESFIERLHRKEGFTPTFVVDSGNGIHAYWEVLDLDAMSFLRLQRRLVREFNTDDAVTKVYQLMRVPGTFNTKLKDELKKCDYVSQTDAVYYSEQLDAKLPAITSKDEEYCQNHFNRTYKMETLTKIEEKVPLKFAKLIKTNNEVKEIWAGSYDDRSKADYRLGHIMFANGFTKEEALSVLVNSAKALQRAPVHRSNYAINIVDKIWTYELTNDKNFIYLSSDVKTILNKAGDQIKGTRFSCWNYLDNTAHGFRLGQVIGLVAGSGVGKTAVALDMFAGFVRNNPDYDHMFISLEQPSNEIAERWKNLCGEDTYLYEKVHIMSNYGEDSNFRHLSLSEIKDYLIQFQKIKNRKIGCVVIDHIGALKKKGKEGENQGLMDICHEMKAFAVQTNTMLIMQSQAPREKAGIGDLELNKDAAYGTVYFESYCDYLIAIWQPLKRCYKEEKCPTVTAFKFCKIRHKNKNSDIIQEDVPYLMYFDSDRQKLREMTEIEYKAFDFFNTRCTNKRKLDRKTDLVEYTKIEVSKTQLS